MKIFPLLVLSVIVCIACQNVADEVVEDSRLEDTVKVFQENPYPTPSAYKYACRCFIDEGGNKANGTYTLYHDNGEISSITTYVNGKYTELYWYYDNGNLKRYEQGNEILKVYFESGQIEQHSIFKNGEWHSGDTSWYENGRIREVKMRNEGKLLWLKEFDDQGNLIGSKKFQD